ncbi:MAG TPA: toll/interleukin-1 receptor domain-containing protein [Longimicrobium sp.]|nr:toll/interleukin-1 receptor domain-containing protein [Longimicrobium sp.]
MKSAAESDPDLAPSRNDAREESGPAAEPETGRGGASSASAGPPEPVLLGGSAPRRARPGDVILAQFAAYVARFEEVARRALEREAAPGEVRLGEETDCRWAVGTRVTVRCTARGLNVFTPTQSFVWDGDCRTLSFDIEVPADARPRDTVIFFEAFVHDTDEAPDAVQVGRLRMSLEIGDKADDQPPRPVHGKAARTAFASYASEDRIDVLERVSSIRRSAGLEVFVDVVSLRMGDEWNPELDRHIRESDRFLLFWSENTPKSKWVTWERQKAVELHGEDVLELHLLRYTPINQVPVDLRRYHFNDIYIIARDAELYRRVEAGKETPQT